MSCRDAFAMLVVLLSGHQSLKKHGDVQTVGVSAVTGEGMPEFFDAVDKCRAEYYREYKPLLDAKQKVRALDCLLERHATLLLDEQRRSCNGPTVCKQAEHSSRIGRTPRPAPSLRTILSCLWSCPQERDELEKQRVKAELMKMRLDGMAFGQGSEPSPEAPPAPS